MGFLDKKKQRGSIAVFQEPLSTPSTKHKSFAPSVHELESKDLKYKRIIRIFRFITRLLSFILNTLMISILAYSFYSYYNTRNHPITPPSSSSQTTAWPSQVILWPTYVLLAMSSVTLLMNISTLLAYCCGVGAANRVDGCSKWIGYIIMGVHVVAWAVAAGAYKMGSTSSSLWGWTCSADSDAIQPQVESFLDFGKLCTTQTGAWWVSVLEAVLYGVSFVTMVMVLQRQRSKKKLAKWRMSVNTEEGYASVELENVDKQGVRYEQVPLAG